MTLNPAVDRESTVPEFAYNVVLRAVARQVDHGGKGFNVSHMLRSWGASSVALVFAGDGRLQDIAQAAGVSRRAIYLWKACATARVAFLLNT